MAPPTVKAAYPLLLLGISLLFSVESENVSIPDIGHMNSTDEPAVAGAQPTTAHVRSYGTKMAPATRRPTHSPAGVNVTAAAEPPVTSAAVASEEPVKPNKSVEGRSEGHEAAISTNGTVPSSPGLPAPHNSSDAPAAAGEAQHTTHNSTRPTRPTEHQQSPSTSPDTETPAAPSATASLSTSAATLPMNSTASPGDSARAAASTQDSRPSSATANHTSEGSPVSDLKSTSSPAGANETSTALPLAPRTVPATSGFPRVAKSTSTAEPPRSSAGPTTGSATAAAASTNSSGVPIPGILKRATSPAVRLTPTAPRGVSKSDPGTGAQTCSTRGVAKTCLIAIACLAALATVFLVTTVVLCTKLSGRRYRTRTEQQGTEFMCISALLPERPHGYARQRNPVTNGVLVIHSRDDSDEDAGDNLTLSSFLPDSNHCV